MAQTRIGGGIYVWYADPVLENLIIQNNSVDHHGGGLYIGVSESVLNNLLIKNNTAGATGSGIYFYSAQGVTLKNSVIAGNSAAAYGL